MEKDAAHHPPPEEDTSTEVDEKETTPPTLSDEKKSIDNGASSLDESPKTLEKASEEKSEDEYPHGLPLFLIMLGLCLAVFLIAIGNFYPFT
jgi:hypothetical protein